MKISIIIPSYNRANLIGRAVQSALAQCSTGDEVIVVDDGSTDGTVAALEPYKDRISIVLLQHAGAGAARNQGVRLARNDLVAFLDSDDEWMPGKLETQRLFMQGRPDILFCFSDFAVKNGAGHEEHNYLKNWHRDNRPWAEILGPGGYYSDVAQVPEGHRDFKFYVGNIYKSELTANYIFAGTLMVRRIEAGEALHFGEGLPTYEDWECFGRLARKGLAAFLECETAWQISHSGDRLTQADILNMAVARITLMERVWGQDGAFLEENSEIYQKALNEQRIQKIRGLIARGDSRSARAELKRVESAPLSYKLLAAMPGPIVSGILKLKRAV